MIKSILKKWPKTIILVLASIPLAALLFIIINLIVNSLPAINAVGFKGLFSTQISGVFTTNQELYGIIPGIWGTVLVTFVSILIALPVSLAMAIFSSEFTLGFLGKGMRTLLGILGGIPYIIYALMGAVFVRAFILPKFADPGVQPGDLGEAWLTRGAMPEINSTLLGGILLSLFIIPFLAPLFDDAIRSVPHQLKEASLSLGANRWETLIRVILPAASSGIISASSLGILKAMGDVVIVGLAIGFESGLPNPLFDILERVAPLTSTGAGFVGGFLLTAYKPIRTSAANFTGLVLLVMAFIVLVLIPVLQRRFKRRFS